MTDKAPVLDGFKAQSFLLGSMSPRVTVREGFDSVSPKNLFYKVVSGQEGSSRAFCDALGLPEHASRLAAGWEDLSPGRKKGGQKRRCEISALQGGLEKSCSKQETPGSSRII